MSINQEEIEECISSWITGPGPLQFYAKEWRCKEPVIIRAQVVFVHGFMEHIDRYDHVFKRFASNGINTFAFDQRGFGKTGKVSKERGITTGDEQIHDLEFFMQKVSQDLKDKEMKVPLFLFGHSMGGGIVLDYCCNSSSKEFAERQKLIMGGVLVSAPLLRVPDSPVNSIKVKLGTALSKYLPSLQIPVGVKPEQISRDPEVVEAYSKDPLCPAIGSLKGVSDMLHRGENLVTTNYRTFPEELPILFVQGDKDEVTSLAATSEFYNNLSAKDKFLRVFEGYYHELHNEIGNDKYIEIDYLIKWILEHL